MKHSPCVAGSWDKADIILAKSPGLFPCPLLTIILLSMFDRFLIHGPKLMKMLEFLSFIVAELFKGMGFDEIKGLAQTMSKGLNFLYLWGEGRDLRLRLVTTGQ